jgi:hypothetical protein
MTQEEIMQEAKKTKQRTIAFIGIPIALVGYSVYKIGKLPDLIPHEKGYVITGLVVGGAFAASSFSLSAAAPSEKQKNASMVGGLTFMTTLGYAITRGIFKQNPKVSLIAGAVLAAATYYVVKHPQILKKPITTNTTPPVENTPKIKAIGE